MSGGAGGVGTLLCIHLQQDTRERHSWEECMCFSGGTSVRCHYVSAAEYKGSRPKTAPYIQLWVYDRKT